MASQKLVRCEIRRRGGAAAGSPRFIPLEIFGLWEYLMSSKHDFEVVNPHADGPSDRVTEVSAFVSSRRDEMFTRACRYFKTEECEQLKPIFLSHYLAEGDKPQTHIRERQGIWLHRTVPA